ncbi:hypothetical protein GEMRC1_001477 [Eukaryota sp. GEM-RC1]
MSSIDDIFNQFDSALQSINAQLNEPTSTTTSSYYSASAPMFPERVVPRPEFATSASILEHSVAAFSKQSTIQNKVQQSIAASKQALAKSEARYPTLFTRSSDDPTSIKSFTQNSNPKHTPKPKPLPKSTSRPVVHPKNTPKRPPPSPTSIPKPVRYKSTSSFQSILSRSQLDSSQIMLKGSDRVADSETLPFDLKSELQKVQINESKLIDVSSLDFNEAVNLRKQIHSKWKDYFG